jgi:uncharacterized membrane protein
MVRARGIRPRESDNEKDTERIEAFSDGVFAIAITLLGLDLLPPSLEKPLTAGDLAELLVDRWPTYAAFVTSFATILIMWIHHHAIFRLIGRSDAALKLANGFVLMMVTAAPFPTAVVSEYLHTPAASVAAAVYGGLFLIANIAYNLLWWVARRRNLLLHNEAEAYLPDISRVYLLGGVFYVLAIVVAFWSPYLSLAICFALWILWAFTARAAVT